MDLKAPISTEIEVLTMQFIVKTSVFVLICVATLSLVQSTPINSIIDIDLLPENVACWFICNACYDSQPAEMMYCANHICQVDFINHIIGYMKIGRECSNYEQLMKDVKERRLQKELNKITLGSSSEKMIPVSN
ncbi:hypothetical protein LOTGIDRAFT_239075 [Lottia gigantea]|uniref:Uncharacterized protein n=1 Tax=Lottia gigantea TaxID=225164 RepID=V4AM17_LOTGI|nr:hypothetical protein LOTGIDRAFT_239075 [Lottia gigantea]ESO98172.1 hypothetical protein LOTGIDRAFT_239075 [Lottia gigantea]